jgi:UDP-glucose 4-epimerase
MSIKYKIKRFIFTSSMAVYGEGKTPFDETNIPNPIDPYGIAKYACEMDLKVAKEQHNLDYCIIRPHNVYGENQNIWDKYRNVLGIWTYKYLNNEPLTIYGDGKQKRAFTYVEDILKPLWNSAIKKETSGEIINLGGIKEIEIKEASEIFREIVNDKEYPIDFLQERHEVKNAWSTHQKSVNLLNFEHKTSLKKGLSKMIEWAKKQPQREIKKWENYELNVDIYEYWK